MAEPLTQDRLRQTGVETAQMTVPAIRLLPRIEWTVDPGTGRPVGRWVLVAEAR